MTDDPPPAEPSQVSAADNPAPAPPAAAGGGRPGVAFLAGLLGAVVVLGLAAGAALVAEPVWRPLLVALVPHPEPGAIESLRTDLDRVRNDVASLARRVEQAEATVRAPAPPAAPAPSVSLEPLVQRLDQLEAAQREVAQQSQRLAKLGDEVERLSHNSVDAAAMLPLMQRLDAVEATTRKLGQRRGSDQALLLAIGQLRETIDAGRPFADELRAARLLGPDTAEARQVFDTLAPKAERGIPTAAELERRFLALEPQLVQADLLPQDDGMVRRTLARLASLVEVERTDVAAPGRSAAAVAARAQGLLRQADLAGAVRELTALDGAAAELAGPWMVDARARLAARKGLSGLTADVLTRVGKAGE